MRRTVLYSVLVFGAALGVARVSGVFAVFTDEAKTGQNSFATGQMARAVDLRLSPGGSSTTCTSYVDDLTTPFYTVTDAQPSATPVFTGNTHCIKNFGSMPATVTFKAIEVTDTETGCTGDEAAAGDTTCGTGAGEVSPNLVINLPAFPCDGGSAPSNQATLATLQTTPAAFATLNPGECRMINPIYTYNPTGNAALMAQSDQVTFKLAFVGTSS